MIKRREIKTKFELGLRLDKIDGAQKEIVEWEGKVQRCQQEFEQISAEIKKEMERFQVKRVDEIKAMIIKYLEDQMAHQQQVFSYTELPSIAHDLCNFFSTADEILGVIRSSGERNIIERYAENTHFVWS